MANRGDAINAVLAATGYNFHRLIRWLPTLVKPIPLRYKLKSTFFTDDYFSIFGTSLVGVHLAHKDQSLPFYQEQFLLLFRRDT
jgi:hypothetical protein